MGKMVESLPERNYRSAGNRWRGTKPSFDRGRRGLVGKGQVNKEVIGRKKN